MMLGWITSWLRPAPIPASAPAYPPSLIDADEYIARARAWRDTGRYDLRCGTGPRGATSPLNAQGRSNCSRYVLFLWGLPGLLPDDLTCAGYGEVNTTAMWHEARGTNGGRRVLLVEVPVSEAQVGDATVYPGVTVGGVRVKIGHTGGIVAVPAGCTSIADMRISHCNAGPAPAIDETNGRGFAAKGAIVVRLAG